MKILEFDTQEEAQAALTLINDIASGWWTQQGFTVENGEVIGKNAKTGEDTPNACRTTSWARIKEHETGGYYFASLSNDPRFVDWHDFLPKSAEIPEDVVFSEDRVD